MKYLAVLFLFAAGPAYLQGQQATATNKKFGFKDRLVLYLKYTYVDPRSHADLIGEVTAGDFVFGGLKPWGSGLSGWGKSLAPAYGQRVVDNTSEMLFGSLIGDDVRYRPLQEHGMIKRGLHATIGAFTAHESNGSTRPAYSRFGAVAASILIANQWLPHPETGGNLTRTVAFGITDKVQGDLLQEFSPDLKRLGRKAWRKIYHNHAAN
jgi:hypothetical protein